MALAGSKRLTGNKVTAIACFDSFGKLAMSILTACRKEGAETTLLLLQLNNRALSRRQRLEIRRIDPKIRIERHKWNDLRQLCGAMAGNVDALILGLDGQRSRDAFLQLQSLWADQDKRPLLISAYPGILFRFGLEGMMDRSGADLLCLNSADDLSNYSCGREALGLDSSNAVVTGLPILWRTKQRDADPEKPTIVFFEQPSIPGHPLQRRFLCEQIKELAEAWPDHPVIFKPRTSSIESTLHRRHGEMASLIDKMTVDQANLRLSFKPATVLLRQCGCAITVSSTAAMESMAMGISTRIIGDLGVTETLGNHFFAKSGAIRNFADIKSNPFEVIHDEQWLGQQGLQRDGEERFIAALIEKLNNPKTSPSAANHGPLSWGSTAWQDAALRNGGRRMLSSSGARSSQRKRHRTRRIVRSLRDGLVGFGWLSKLLREK